MKISKIAITTAIELITGNIKYKTDDISKILPKGLSLEKDMYKTMQRDFFEKTKDSIQDSINQNRK